MGSTVSTGTADRPAAPPVPVRSWHVLSGSDTRLAAQVAHARMESAWHHGRTGRWGASDDPARALSYHLTGARCELAFLRMLGLPLSEWQAWTPGSLSGLPCDVAGCQVRGTKHPGGKLRITPPDVTGPHGHQPYVLVTDDGAQQVTPGWAYAGIVRGRREWWYRIGTGTRPAAWWVPQKALTRW